MTDAAVDSDFDVVDFKRGLTDKQKKKITIAKLIASEVIEKAVREFQRISDPNLEQIGDLLMTPESCTVFEHQDFPGRRDFPD